MDRNGEIMDIRLADTATLMTSKNYIDRFIAEYHQLRIRYESLNRFVNKIEACEMVIDSDDTSVSDPENIKKFMRETPRHNCPLELLENQRDAMQEYLHWLEVRAEVEHIDLTKVREVKSNDGKVYKFDLSNAKK